MYHPNVVKALSRLAKRNYGRIREELTPILDLKSVLARKRHHEHNAVNRRAPVDMNKLETLYGHYCQLTRQIQEHNRQRKMLAGEFAKNREVEDALKVMDHVYSVKDQIETLKTELEVISEQLRVETLLLPNDTDPSAPIGGPEKNLVVETFGEQRISPCATVVDHVELAKRLDIVDLEAAARTSGSSFYFLKNEGALLENALIQYSLSMAIKHGFRPIIPPDVVYSKFIRACGFFPRVEGLQHTMPAYVVDVDGEQQNESPTKVLAATGEIPLAAYYSGKVLDKTQLPIKWVAVSHCFRPETGHYGSETRGLYRVHQFTKVELFIIKDDNMTSSNIFLQEIVDLQKSILGPLGLSCRVLNMATEELGASAYQKFDIEAYFPCRAGWGELTSASNCTDYQSRRLSLRFRPDNGCDLKFVHTLNGTACAIPRVIQAILESHQQPDGTINIPTVLHPFMLDGSTKIGPK